MGTTEAETQGPVEFGRYTLIRKLALGGMAEIFLARQDGPAGFTRDLVIKRVLPHVADNADFVEMFLDEAKLAAQLSHPNIVPIFEFGRVESSYFIAMELVRGPDLKRLLYASAKGTLRLPFALQAKIISGCAEGLEYAHQLVGADGQHLGIVHRDISPSNVIVTYEGIPKVLDFGIAKAASRSHKTQTGVLKGKVPYMPPEQLMGRPVDGRTDVYALGVVLFELATRQLPYVGDSDFHLMRLICDSPIPPPRSRVADVPEGLEQIIVKAMAKNPDDRYPSAREMSRDLERFVLESAGPVSSFDIAEYLRSLETEVGEPLSLGSGPRTNPSMVRKSPSGVQVSPLHAPPVSAAAAADGPADASGDGADVDLGGLGGPTVADVSPPSVQAALQDARTERGSDVWEVTQDEQDVGFTDPDAVGSVAAVAAAASLGAEATAESEPGADPHPHVPKADMPTAGSGPSMPSAGSRPPMPSLTGSRPPVQDAGVSMTLMFGVAGIVIGVGLIILATIYYTTRGPDTPAPLLADAVADAEPVEPDVAAADAADDAAVGTDNGGVVVGAALGTDPASVDAEPVGDDADDVVPADTGVAAVPKKPAVDARKPPPPKSKKKSYVVLQSSPWAEVYRSGKKVGVTPLKLELPSGRHTLVLKNPKDGTQQSLRIKLRSGQTLTRMVKFVPGTLAVLVTPWGEVWIDGKKIGVTPIQPVSLSAGKHTVEVKQPKTGKSVTRSVVIQPGKSQRLKIELK